MRKVLVVTILILCACKKENNTVTHKSFYGKWFYVAAINKEYTVDNGDTTFSRIDSMWYNGDYIDFTQQGVAAVFTASTQQTDSVSFEEITPVFFRLDALLCEATTITDSALLYNSLDFSYDETPKVKVSQTFYTLKR